MEMLPSPLLASRRGAALIALLVLASTAATARAQEPPAPAATAASASDAERTRMLEAIEALRREHATQRDQIQLLRSRIERIEKPSPERPSPGRAEDEEDRRHSPTVVSRGVILTLSGFFHADFLARIPGVRADVNPTTGQPTNELRFLIKRARFRIDARWGILSGGLEFDGNTGSGPTARIQSAEVAMRWAPRNPEAVPYLMVTVGLFKMPFGYEIRLQSDKERHFMERSLIGRALFPGEYDLGVKVQGGYRWLRYNLALMNGAPSGEKQFALRDPTRSKDVLGRIGFDPPRFGPVTFVIGASGLYGSGFHQGATASDGQLVWVDANGDGLVGAGELTNHGARLASASSTFSRWAAGGDIRVIVQLPRVGALMAYAEVIGASNLDRGQLVADPVKANRALRELGYYVAVTQELTRWAMIGVRFDEYLPDRDAPTVAGSDAAAEPSRYSTLAVSAVARYASYGRIFFEYDYNRTGLRSPGSGAVSTKVDHLLGARAELTF